MTACWRFTQPLLELYTATFAARRSIFLSPSSPRGVFRRQTRGGAWCGPAGGICNPAPGRLRGSARWALRPSRAGRQAHKAQMPKCRVRGSAAGAGEPVSLKCRGEAPRGAPVSVIGRWSSFAKGTGPTVRRPPGAAFRTSALRRFTPLTLATRGTWTTRRTRRLSKNTGGEALLIAWTNRDAQFCAPHRSVILRGPPPVAASR